MSEENEVPSEKSKIETFYSPEDKGMISRWKTFSGFGENTGTALYELCSALTLVIDTQDTELSALRASWKREKEDLMDGIRGLNIVLTQLRQQAHPQAALLQPGQNLTAKTEQCTEAMLPKKDIHTPNQPPFALPICA